MGLRLKGMADEPTWRRPNGSAHSPKGGDISTRKSKANLCKEEAMPLSTPIRRKSCWRV